MRTILLLRCPDQTGIIARYSALICDAGGNILRSDQYSTHPQGGEFFMRVEFDWSPAPEEQAAFAEQCRVHAEALGGSVRLYDARDRMRMAIAVSQYDHCLIDLLYRVRAGELSAEVACVVSNHEVLRPLVENDGIEFVHLPVNAATKAEQEAAFLEAVAGRSDFLVMARYMQILSDDFLRGYGKDVINIHHSFLPGFKGANPYRQAYERGVKVIGATAHFATPELDEGPIIEQMVDRVSPRDDVEQLKRKGRHLEQQALARAVQAYIEHRVIRLAQRTVVFE
ncbi:MAG: formyltetrahydrofolate deformylase [Candidatus Hydrogenedens sp.]|nr:formyltetrahydrofolate deformylase [Candidatus Hydrogenedens sp.]